VLTAEKIHILLQNIALCASDGIVFSVSSALVVDAYSKMKACVHVHSSHMLNNLSVQNSNDTTHFAALHDALTQKAS
jgi:hypothetical protein